MSVDHFGRDGSEPPAADGSKNTDDAFTTHDQVEREGSSTSGSSGLETAAGVAVANAQTYARQNPPCFEPRMGTRYWPTTLSQLSPALLAAWQQSAHVAEGAAIDAIHKQTSEGSEYEGNGDAVSLSLPPLNPFVAVDFTIRSDPTSAAQASKDAAQQETALLRNPKHSALDASALAALVEAYAHTDSDADPNSNSSSGTGNSGGGGGERKKCKTESGPVPGDRNGSKKGNNAAGAKPAAATKPVGSLPGPPFPRPSDTPAPCVPQRRFGFERSGGGVLSTAVVSSNTAKEEEQQGGDSSPVFVELWHALDHKFALPRIECFLKLALPTAQASPAGAAAADLMVSESARAMESCMFK